MHDAHRKRPSSTNLPHKLTVLPPNTTRKVTMKRENGMPIERSSTPSTPTSFQKKPTPSRARFLKVKLKRPSACLFTMARGIVAPKKKDKKE